MRFLNFIKLPIVFTTMLVVGACVPKAADKKASCAENQAFDSVTRSCYSITEIRYKPVATLSTETLSQETPKTITLTYTDKNNDQAVSCTITGSYSKVEIMSPAILNGNLFNEAFYVQDSIEELANAINASVAASVAIKNAANAAKLAVQTAYTTAKTSYSHSKVVSQIGILKTQANVVTALAVNFPTDATIQFYYNNAQTKLTSFESVIASLTNKCECNGGVCSTLVIPKINETGTERFSYAVTDIDGTGTAKTVTTTISAMAATTSHLKPVAGSSYEIFAESATSTASVYTFTLPSGADLFGTTGFKYTFKGSKNGSNEGLTSSGKVWGCMDLTGSSGTTDTTCSYSPNSGDTYDANTVVAAANTIDDLTYEALNPGTYGSNITIQYFNLQNYLTSVDPYLTKAQIYGMISVYNESFVRVVGNAIKVFINPGFTSSSDIQSLINSHVQASKMVYVTGGSASNFPVPSALTPTAKALSSAAGGVDGADAFDKIPFTISNSSSTSANDANVMVKVASTDDVPAMNFVASTASSALEDSNPVVINLSSTYTDVDTDDVIYYNGCQVNPADATFLANFTVNSCTCVLSACSLNITPSSNVSSTTPFTFSYRIGSSVGLGAFNPATAQWTAYRNYSLTMTPVNDAPTITGTSNQTIAESTSTVPNSGYIDVTVAPGGGGFESTQTLTLTATSSNTTLLPNANIVITTPSAGVRRVTYTPVVNKSGSATINLTLKDNGGTSNGGVDTSFGSFLLTVTPVDDPPYFISMFATVDTNEGGAVQTDGIQVDEDMGSSSDEDTQGVRISAVSSDNTTVLPTTAISFFYDLNDNGVLDSGEARAVGQVLENAAADDAKLHKIYFKLSPVNGEDGNSNIGITISDGTSTTNKMFSLVVHPISSQHGGWENIAAIGIKTDKKGLPVSIDDQQCNYNVAATDTYKCSGSDCTGTASPHGVIVPDAANVIFYDSANKKCYRSTSASEFSWVDLKTSCPITRAAGVCSDNNCISTSVPTPSFVGQFHYDTDDGTCSISKSVTPATWETYIPSKVTLAWKPFSIAGTGADSGVQIAGWNVYRREPGTDFNLRGGHLKVSTSTTTMTITDPSVRTFTDNTAIAGKVYYYLVRAVDNRRSLPTYTDALYSEVRITAPTENYSFVHRWMINQEICNSMNMTTSTTNKVDPTNNFRCPYYGPGATGGYYDYGSDLLVDVQEMGCAYAAAPKCSSDGCVGIGAPSSTTGVATNDLYYDRSSGSCWVYNAGWVNTNSLVAGDVTKITTAAVAAASKLRTSLNAPLVNIPQSNAVAICSNRPNQISLYSGLTAGALTPKLPSKKDFIAFSSHTDSMNDADISDLEQGFSLNIQSRCNGSAASGLETTYSDSPIPSTSNMFTLPGTAASTIRSLVTGSIPLGSSKSTESCVSRYGVQDVYGNVAEWTTDTMTCAAKVCTPSGTSSMSFDFDPSGSTKNYAFDLVTGPYYDTDNDTVVGSAGDMYITDWTLADELFESGKFSLPTGMPISNNISTDSATLGSPAIPFILDIGPSSGITSSKLHDDGFILNGANGSGSLAVGGSFASGARSGRWTTELVPDASYADDIGFRCVVPILKTSYPADTQHAYPY